MFVLWGQAFIEGNGMIRDERRIKIMVGVVGVIALSFVLFCADDVFAQDRRGGSGKIKVGEPAPDFELPRLIISRDSQGKPIGKISEEKIKLSSFRGKKPVCMIMSSYT